MIEVRDLRVDYDQSRAVRDLTFRVGPGEVFGLIGPNGAGKTTTLRSLTGLIEPTYGDIILNGIDVREHREEADRFVGFMPDSAPLYGDLTVSEYLDMFAASYMIPPERRAAAVSQSLALVDLTEKRDTFTSGLSRGMKQRLILAKTLLPDPKILLLDEPASGLDPHGRAMLRSILRRLGSEGKTVIISSHILSELSDFCTSVGIMERGQMVLSGQVDEVSARVLGEARMCVEIVDGEEALRAVLAGSDRAGQVTEHGCSFEFGFRGGPLEASELLACMVSAGVSVASFGRKQGDLEEVFLKVGAKEVS